MSMLEAACARGMAMEVITSYPSEFQLLTIEV
jgi:hypothetical protein